MCLVQVEYLFRCPQSMFCYLPSGPSPSTKPSCLLTCTLEASSNGACSRCPILSPRILHLVWPSPACYNHLKKEKEYMDKSSLSFSLSLPLKQRKYIISQDCINGVIISNYFNSSRSGTFFFHLIVPLQEQIYTQIQLKFQEVNCPTLQPTAHNVDSNPRFLWVFFYQ